MFPHSLSIRRSITYMFAITSATALLLSHAAALGPPPPGRPIIIPPELFARPDHTDWLETTRRKYDFPALAAAIITSDKVVAMGVTGYRKYGDPTPATINDQFHLGSDTKSMTATLIGMLVEQHKLEWKTTLAKALPDLAKTMLPDYRTVTIEQVMGQRSGFSNETALKDMTMDALRRLKGSPMQQREVYVKKLLQEKPTYKPGSKYLYSNRNYALLGAIVEKITKTPWESYIQQKLFQPLGMTTAGFGAMGTSGAVDQPWQHRIDDQGNHIPIEPGPFSDNPSIIAPAGLVHCSIGDWAKYIQMHLKGARGVKTLLSPETIKKLHQPVAGGDYAGGWIVTHRDWAGGDNTALTHAGSNTQNYAVVWIAPGRDFAVLIATNQGGGQTDSQCDAIAGELIMMVLNAAQQ